MELWLVLGCVLMAVAILMGSAVARRLDIYEQSRADRFPRYMWATRAFARQNGIGRVKGDICRIEREDRRNYYGSWVTGYGFINVRFPKTTTRELTQEEREFFHGKAVVIGSTVWPALDLETQTPA